jgi:predicted acylesterase/phospholipase RssA
MSLSTANSRLRGRTTLQRNPSEYRSRHPASNYDERSRTAFVFAGGGSFGAIHVGMLHSLASRGIADDMVVG